jgi:hypothetical protein
MSHIQKQVGKLFGDLVDKSDLKDTDEELQYKILTRALSAYSIYILGEYEPNQIAPYIIDGGDDNGIDCFYYDSKEKIMYISQAKWIKNGSGEPESGDVKKFADGIRDLVNLKFERFNKKLQKHSELITQIMDDPNTKYTAIISFTGINKLAQHSKRTLDDLSEEMNDASDLLKIIIQNQTYLHDSLRKTITREPIILDVALKYWGKVDEPYRAFYGQLNASTIGEWWKLYNVNLFDKNLRSVLGETDVNEEIENTLFNNPELFWFYNNGITILAEKIQKTMTGGGDTDFGTFHCENISVVNGAQTVSTIGKYAFKDSERIKKANVHCRIIDLNEAPSELSVQITKTNNRQNKIENRDFVSLDPEQIRIKNEVALEGYQYIIQRNETIQKSDKLFDLIDSTTALCCISLDPMLFVQLKREIGKLWEDISKAPYKKLFNASISSLFVLRAMIIQRKIDADIDKIQKKGTLDNHSKHVLIHGNRLIASRIFKDLPINDFNNPSYDFDKIMTNNFEAKIKVHLKKLITKINKLYPNAIVPTLFKNFRKCNELFKII